MTQFRYPVYMKVSRSPLLSAMRREEVNEVVMVVVVIIVYPFRSS